MLARSAKPKLTLNLSSVTSSTPRPVLALKSPMTPLRSPVSPAPGSPTAFNTKMNQRGVSTPQHPTYAYVNHSTLRSILKKGNSPSSIRRRLQFSERPEVLCFSPIEDDGYYGEYKRMSREERRWQARS